MNEVWIGAVMLIAWIVVTIAMYIAAYATADEENNEK